MKLGLSAGFGFGLSLIGRVCRFSFLQVPGATLEPRELNKRQKTHLVQPRSHTQHSDRGADRQAPLSPSPTLLSTIEATSSSAPGPCRYQSNK